MTIFAFEGMAISTAMPVAGAELGAARGYGLAFSVLVTLQVLGTVLAGPWCDTSGPLPVVIAGQLLFAAGVPVATVSVGGARNAGLLAARIIGSGSGAEAARVRDEMARFQGRLRDQAKAKGAALRASRG